MVKHSNGIHLSRHEIRKYHYELKKISRDFKRGHHRLSRKERKALSIYQLRHGHNYQA